VPLLGAVTYWRTRSAHRAFYDLSMGCEPEGYLALVGKGRFRRLLRSGAAEGEIGRMECRLIRRVEAEGELGGAEGDGGRTTVITGEEGDSSLLVLTNFKGPAGTVFKSPYLLWCRVENLANCLDVAGRVGLCVFVHLWMGIALVHVAGTV
jgi:hypothetical protein